MSDREYYGKEDEKEDEKETQKRDEKWRRDPLSAVVWAALLIWGGVTLLLGNLGVLDDLTILGYFVEGWSLFFLGAGVIVLVEVAARLVVPSYRRGVGGSIFFAAILLGIGLGKIVSWPVTGAVILIALGVSTLIRGLFRSD